MTFSYMGFGTTFYGERDYYSDGSSLTTEWVTALYVPIFPIRSVRTGPAEGGFNIGVVASMPYEEYWSGRPHPKQVACVYLFLTAIALYVTSLSVFFGVFQEPHSPWQALFAIPFFYIVPWWLHKRARKEAGLVLDKEVPLHRWIKE